MTALMLFGSSPAVREKVVQLVLELVDNDGPFAKKGLSKFLEAYACTLGDGGTQSTQETKKQYFLKALGHYCIVCEPRGDARSLPFRTIMY